jgi:hypothetical protein
VAGNAYFVDADHLANVDGFLDASDFYADGQLHRPARPRRSQSVVKKHKDLLGSPD